MPNWSKTFQTFWSYSFIFPLPKQPKNLNFQSFLPLIDTLVATVNETRAPTSRKHVSEKGIVNSSWSKTFQSFSSHSYVFPLKKEPKNLNFQSFFTSNRPFGGYFRWNACTYFQKICSWTRYSDAKLIQNISHFLVALLCFYFWRTT